MYQYPMRKTTLVLPKPKPTLRYLSLPLSRAPGASTPAPGVPSPHAWIPWRIVTLPLESGRLQLKWNSHGLDRILWLLSFGFVIN
jgi:hypothetical protein